MPIPLGPHCTKLRWEQSWIPAVSSETTSAPEPGVPWAQTESGWISSGVSTHWLPAPLGAPPFPAVFVLSLAGPALVHTERAQAGERPALLQTVQRQPAPGHGEVIVTAVQ